MKRGSSTNIIRRDEVVRARIQGENIEILSREAYLASSATIASSPPLPGSFEALDDALDRFVWQNPDRFDQFFLNLGTTFDLHDAQVLKADPPLYQVAMGYTIRGRLNNNQISQVRNDVFEVRWQNDDVEVFEWGGPYEPVVARPEESWPPPPGDPVLLALEELLWQARLSLEWEIAANVSGVQEARLIELRALGQMDTMSAVLIQFDGTWSTAQLPSQMLVFDISMASGSPEVLGHRDYVATEWQSADLND